MTTTSPAASIKKKKNQISAAHMRYLLMQETAQHIFLGYYIITIQTHHQNV